MPKKITSEISSIVFSLPWLVARDEGLFAQEGLEVEFVRAQGRGSLPGEANQPQAIDDPNQVGSFLVHGVFEEKLVDLYRACEWGQIRRAQDSGVGGQIIGMRPAIGTQAIFVGPGSALTHPQDLRNQSVGVNFHAGSHYITLQMLEGFLEQDEIKVVHLGDPRLRYQAMLNGEVAAASLMEPWIALAEKKGCSLIMEAYYIGSDIAAESIDAETFQAINRAIALAVQLINADKRKYLHYLIDDVPPELGSLSPDDFRLSRLRYVEPKPYPAEEFERTLRWMLSWGLISPDANFEDLVDNRISRVS